MNTIHGITFNDYAATTAFLAQGKDINELLPLLEIEISHWDKACTYWQNEMDNDYNYELISIFEKVFQNPAQGKFAGMNTQTTEDALPKIPTLERFIEIQAMINAASVYGIDEQTFLDTQGLSVLDYSQLSIYWMNYRDEQISPANIRHRDFRQWFFNTHQYYQYKAEEFFASKKNSKTKDEIIF